MANNRAIVACLAGRRIDAEDAPTPRFPLNNVPKVQRELGEAIEVTAITHLICSAACGADILALEACQQLGVATTIVLPFSAYDFRVISVTDRPGAWGPRFDRLIARARAEGALVEMGCDPGQDDAFEQANIEIVARTVAAPADERVAFIVWEGAKRGADDATADVRDRATAHGFRTIEVQTLEAAIWG